jgi:hypothetical protein
MHADTEPALEGRFTLDAIEVGADGESGCTEMSKPRPPSAG